MGKLVEFQPKKPKGTIKNVFISIDESYAPKVEEWNHKSGRDFVGITACNIKLAASLLSQYVNGKGNIVHVDGDAKDMELKEITRQGDGRYE